MFSKRFFCWLVTTLDCVKRCLEGVMEYLCSKLCYTCTSSLSHSMVICPCCLHIIVNLGKKKRIFLDKLFTTQSQLLTTLKTFHLVTIIFFISHNVFYLILDKFCNLNYLFFCHLQMISI